MVWTGESLSAPWLLLPQGGDTRRRGRDSVHLNRRRGCALCRSVECQCCISWAPRQELDHTQTRTLLKTTTTAASSTRTFLPSHPACLISSVPGGLGSTRAGSSAWNEPSPGLVRAERASPCRFSGAPLGFVLSRRTSGRGFGERVKKESSPAASGRPRRRTPRRETVRQQATMPGFDYKFLEKPKRRFQCPLCSKAMREPVQVSTCGHRFCDTCLQEFLR